mgnify:CR=1 FL=1
MKTLLFFITMLATSLGCKQRPVEVDKAKMKSPQDKVEQIHFTLLLEDYNGSELVDSKETAVTRSSLEGQVVEINLDDVQEPGEYDDYFYPAYVDDLQLIEVNTMMNVDPGEYQFFVIKGSKNLFILRSSVSLEDLAADSEFKKDAVGLSGNIIVGEHGYIAKVSNEGQMGKSGFSWSDFYDALGQQEESFGLVAAVVKPPTRAIARKPIKLGEENQTMSQRQKDNITANGRSLGEQYGSVKKPQTKTKPFFHLPSKAVIGPLKKERTVKVIVGRPISENTRGLSADFSTRVSAGVDDKANLAVKWFNSPKPGSTPSTEALDFWKTFSGRPGFGTLLDADTAKTDFTIVARGVPASRFFDGSQQHLGRDAFADQRAIYAAFAQRMADLKKAGYNTANLSLDNFSAVVRPGKPPQLIMGHTEGIFREKAKSSLATSADAIKAAKRATAIELGEAFQKSIDTAVKGMKSAGEQSKELLRASAIFYGGKTQKWLLGEKKSVIEATEDGKFIVKSVFSEPKIHFLFKRNNSSDSNSSRSIINEGDL